MTKFAFYAEDYEIGDSLKDFGWRNNSSSDVVVADDGNGNKFFTDCLNNHFEGLGQVADGEIYLVVRGTAYISRKTCTVTACHRAPLGQINDSQYQLRVVSRTFSGTGQDYLIKNGLTNIATFNDDSEIFPDTDDVFFAIKGQVRGQNLKLKGWQVVNVPVANVLSELAATEPAGWQVETTDATYTTGYLGFHTGDSLLFVGVGSDADDAPMLPIPSPILAAPTDLNVTNITASGATLNWS